MSDAPILRMEAIYKSFPGVKALSNAQLSVNTGEVMALMGANGAGKSTLMNVLGGVLIPDEGKIIVAGKEVSLHSPRESRQEGIAFVHQELTMFGTMSVLENLFIDDTPGIVGQSTLKTMRSRASELLKRVGADVSLDMPVEQLGTGDQQLIEIARALRDNPKIIILDEPTSSLSERERKRLFDVIRALRAEGAAIVFITHFIDEIFEVCDRLNVMRDGETVAQTKMSEVNATDVVRYMLGPTEEQGRMRPFATEPFTTEILRINDVSRKGTVSDITFSLFAGEVVGLWGLLGSGRTEIIRSIVGLDPIDTGTLQWQEDGKLVNITQSELRDRIGLVTEDRRGEGIIGPMSIRENVALPNIFSLSDKFGIVNKDQEKKITDSLIEKLSIKVSGPLQKIATLSGGNQQKVVMGRWLEANPEIFFLDEPTRGLDVKAKGDILKLVANLAAKGCAVLIVSSELDELMRICDRYLVISRGKIIKELPGQTAESDLMSAVG